MYESFGRLIVFRTYLRLIQFHRPTSLQEYKMATRDSPWLISLSHSKSEQHKDGSIITIIFRSTVWTIKITLRIMILSSLFIPLFITLPLTYVFDAFRQLWWKWILWLVQRSGPTFIKLGQWASTRRDIFSKEFCDRMSVLHTKTRCHLWHHSQHALDQLFGDSRWKNFLVSVAEDPVGSGCIAQVYKGVVDVYAFEEVVGIQLPFSRDRYLDVAIKVARNGVRESIQIDLFIMQCIAQLMQMILPGLSFVNPVSCLNQFKTMLELQRFSTNFDVKKTSVRFPQVLCFSKDVIIETFEEGSSVNKLVMDEEMMHYIELKKEIALLGARALLKMIFVDNFVHGDLHPGNILFRNFMSFNGGIRMSNCDIRPEIHKRPTLIMLDTGIALEETPKNLEKLRLLFRAVIDKKGREVGKLLLIHSPKQNCKDPEQFFDDVDRIVQIARSKNDLRRLNISQILNELFSIVRHHKVSLDPSFTTVVLAVIVLEGLGRIPIQRSYLDDFIRAAERDNLLLYVTAAVGVFMPGCVYMFYQYVHKLYSGYDKKRERKSKDQRKFISATVFYTEGRNHITELANLIGARLNCERLTTINLADVDTSSFMNYNGIGLFLIDSEVTGCESKSIEWFLEFLEDIAYDQNSANLPCRQIRFAVLGIGDLRENYKLHNRTAKALARRLCAIGARALCPLYYIFSHSNSGLEKKIYVWASYIAKTLVRRTISIKRCPRSFWYYKDESDTESDEDYDEQKTLFSEMECISESEDYTSDFDVGNTDENETDDGADDTRND
ncbi:unnamed protein product [Thelazia callipaeda]|uniref:Flavodoxin-like domain-containing protein n=1 Tax=Thelazia callipaeda TaxID=103827 RepID=A0A0N5D197_THECL|nr:unnamed protein product [Thelazia callipaeda]